MIPSQQAFTDLFDKYLIDAREARATNKAERHRSALFLGFVSQAFQVETSQILLEQTVPLATVKRTGFIDALFGDLVFEFKRRIDKDKPRYTDQLRNYLLSLTDDQPYIGLLTDGLEFEVYTLEGEALRQTDSFNLETTDAETAFIRLDAYLFSQKNVHPTSADIVQRFGGTSPTFQAAFRELHSLLAHVDSVPKLAVWREQWRRLLSKVYGSDIGSDDLFLRHTYLCQFARLLAYAALRGIPDSDATVKSIITGEAFAGQGVSNIAETDFFSWVLMPDIQDEAIRLFRRLAEGLIVYDLGRIDQDLLKQLYQNLVDPETRHELGEYYTPDWLAELTLEDINYEPGQSLLDPACGSGSFLFSAIKRLAAQGLTGWALVEFAVDNVVGMDVHPHQLSAGAG
jgi:N-6 DNA Methylase